MNRSDGAARGIAALRAAIQHNCDLADALHAREQGLCTYLLAMREQYRWTVGASLDEPPDRNKVGAWIAERERLWERLLDGVQPPSFARLPVGDGADPFDEAAVNAWLAGAAGDGASPLVYGAGLGRFRAPLFFLGEVAAEQVREGVVVVVTERELARGLAAPPGALRGGRVLIRRDALRRWLWTRAEGARLRPPGRATDAGQVDAFAALLARFGGSDRAAAIERIVDTQTETLVLHELGELRAGRQLGTDWEAMLAAADRRTELVLRALRDLLADALVTVPTLIERRDDAALAFWFANLEGTRRALAAPLWAAGSADLPALAAAADDAANTWRAMALALRDTWRSDGLAALAAAAGAMLDRAAMTAERATAPG